MASPSPAPHPSNEQQFSQETAAVFLRKLFHGQDRGFAVLHTLPDRHSAFYDLTEKDWPERMADAAIRKRSYQDVYYAVCSQNERPQRGRGGVQTVRAIPGLWADIDIWHAKSKRDDLPRSEEDAWQIIDRIPIRPTIVVRSGNGLHVYWLFREPLEITTPAERQSAMGLSVAFLRYVQARAAEQGWHVDATADLARILRIPGTTNNKQQQPRLVTFQLTDDEPRSNPSEWLELLDYEDDPELARTVSVEVGDHNLGADFGLILQGCSWLRSTVENSASLSEPEWYRSLAVAGRCRDGRRLAHEISHGYPNYSPAETDEKLKQACTASRAPRCTYIGANFDAAGEHCRKCEHKGLINSPVKLGFRRPTITVPPADGAPPSDQPETVQDAVQRLITHGDIPGIFAIIPQIAQLQETEYTLLKLELKKQFGREWPNGEFNRLVKVEQERARAERARIDVQSRPEWERDLLRTMTGAPKPNLANAVCALRYAPEWEGVIGFDEFSNQVTALKDAPIDRCPAWTRWRDDHFSQVACWLQKKDINVSSLTALEAVATVSRTRTYHPVQDYLNGLRWDGESRIDQWLTTYAQVPLTEYSATVGAKWLVSAVARVLDPGCKVDTCLILEGDQGLKKSQALRVLGDPWFSDELGELGDKDTAMKIQGVWIVEIGEMSALSRAEVGAIKHWMSMSTDRFRPSYGRVVGDYPRQCVFAGTVNPGGNGYLRDDTGGRRFWPVECQGKADLDALRADKDQLWAEAVERFREGATWWSEDASMQALMAAEVAARYEEDPWQPVIEMWLETLSPRFVPGLGQTPVESQQDRVYTFDVLWHAIGKPVDRQVQTDLNRVGRCLRALGWKRKKLRAHGSPKWCFVKE